MIGLRNTAVTVMATVYVAAILCGCGDRQDVVEDPSLRLSADTPQPTVVAYKRIDGQELTAHVFLPADWKATDRRPAYLWLHGGGFVVGSPEAGYDVAEVVAARGIVGISVQYRLAVLDVPGTKIDAQIADAKSIVRWVRRRAGQLGVDPERIVGGGSLRRGLPHGRSRDRQSIRRSWRRRCVARPGRTPPVVCPHHA